MNSSKKIAIASDHAGFELKEKLKKYLSDKGIHLQDFGTYSLESCDYPDYTHPLADFVIENSTLGIAICGSGNGVNITANKHQGVRSALSWLPEIAELARLHNDANVLAIPARFITEDIAIQIVDKFLSTPFEGGRHLNRVNKIEQI